jgi:hypothetical protein
MPELLLHKRPVQSVFSLIGENENDITFSIGWALSQSPGLLKNLLRKALRLRNNHDPNQTIISLQESNSAAGSPAQRPVQAGAQKANSCQLSIKAPAGRQSQKC